jgi:CHAT domain-containing protein/Tfp pilus assembly protein PilF
VEQRGCDVILELRPAAGGAAVAVDSPSGRHGREWALVPGRGVEPWVVRVRSSPSGGSGVYRLEVAEVPAMPGARFEAEVEAELAWTEASAAFHGGDAQARVRALRRLGDALPTFRRAADLRRNAEALLLVAELSRIAGRDDRVQALLGEAEALWRTAGDRFGEAQALTTAAYGSWRAGRMDEALSGYRRALELYRGLGDPYGAAQVLNNLGHAHLHRGKPRPARGHFLEALDAAREAAAPHLEAALLNNLGGVHEVLGELTDAIRYFERARELHAKLDRRRDEARAVANSGAAHRSLGDYVAALERFLEARELFVEAGDAAGEATTLNSIGSAYLAVGEPERARAHLRQALPLRRAAADRRGEAATLHNLARAAHALGEPETARDLFLQALALRRELDDPRGEATTLDHLGALQLDTGDVEAALASLRRSLELRRRVGDPRREARALRQLGEAEAAAGRPEAASDLLEEALALERAPAAGLERVATLHALAKVRRAQGRSGEAADRLDRALEILEAGVASLPDPDLEAAFYSGHRQVYELAVAIAMERHRADPGAGHHLRALELSERARSRGLLALLAEAEVEIDHGVAATLLERRDALAARLAGKAAARRRLLDRGTRATELPVIEAEILHLLVELEAAAGEIRRQNPRYASLVRPRAPSAGELQELVGADTLLLEYSLGDERSYLWAVSADEVTVYELPPRRRVEAACRRLYEAWSRLDAGAAGEAAVAEEVAAILLGPLGDRLDRRRRLAVVADGALHYLPFAALPRPAGAGGIRSREALLLDHEVIHLPSASVLAALRERPRKSRPEGVLAVLAAPSFASSGAAASGDGAWPPLPWSRREAEAIAALTPPEATLLALGDRASRDLALGGRLGGFRFVHFATHGVLDGDHPALSGLALGAGGRDGETGGGFLGLRDLYGLDLRADLVVLSGCRTALGREVRGEGLVGLTRGFLAAGAERVVASLWPVQDRATAELMVAFYRSMLDDGLAPAAALRAAQTEIRRQLRWRDPYFWAGFVLVGDWE